MSDTQHPEICSATRIPATLDPRWRPIAHPTAPAGWLNDPNGPIHHQGRYHLYYQHNPRSASFDPHMHWGHLSSVDLARWRHHPIALIPESTGPDRGGCWSGCAVVDEDGRPQVIYSTPEQRVCRAIALDSSLETWSRPSTVALLDETTNPTGSPHHRDPCVFRHDGSWLMILGGQRAGRGCIEAWRSTDLEVWEHLGCALQDDGQLPLPLDHGAIWECASLFPLDGRWVLLLSCCDWSRGLRRSIAYVGDFDGRRFRPGHGQLFDHGLGACYAGITCADAAGRRLLWSWICEGPGADSEAWGWAGCLSWPLQLSLVNDRLHGQIPAELSTLRRAGSQRSLQPGSRDSGSSVELALGYRQLGAFPVGLRVLDDDDGHALRITIDPTAACMVVDRSDWLPDSGSDDNHRARHIAPLDPADLAECHLRVVVDRSLVHVHCNGRVRITTRVYPAQGADGITLLGNPEYADCWDLDACILDA